MIWWAVTHLSDLIEHVIWSAVMHLYDLSEYDGFRLQFYLSAHRIRFQGIDLLGVIEWAAAAC